MNVSITIAEPRRKPILDSLLNCRANFTYVNSLRRFNIYEVERVNLTGVNAMMEISITFKVLENNTTAMIIIPFLNIDSMEIA